MTADKSDKHRFIQLRKENGVALYRRERLDGSLFSYELFIIKVVKEGSPLPNGTLVKETYEQYPGAKTWGKTAWSPSTLESCNKRFDELVEKVKSLEGQPKRRGRKSNTLSITLPKTKFTMNELINLTGLSQPVLYIHLKKMIAEGKVMEVGRVKKEGGRGRAMVVYKVK